jgi:gamma-glutamylcyclotransferase (GGCT)/AIG2-like uncharacterized protein YtfP
VVWRGQASYDEEGSAGTRELDVKTPHGSPGTFLLFVYGTLKRGGDLHGPLAGQVYRGKARTLPQYTLHHLGEYPGLVASPATGRVVRGELYEVDCSLLDWLDRVEGAPQLFALEPVELEGVAGPVWTYFLQLDPADWPVIEAGAWGRA